MTLARPCDTWHLMRSPLKRAKLEESIADEIREAIERTGIKPVSELVGVSRHGLVSVLAGMSTPAHTLYVAACWQERKGQLVASATGAFRSNDETAHYRCEV